MVDDTNDGNTSSEDIESVTMGYKTWKQRARIILETLIRAKPLSKLVGCDAFQFRENSKINWVELQNQGHYSIIELLLNMIRALFPR